MAQARGRRGRAAHGGVRAGPRRARGARCRARGGASRGPCLGRGGGGRAERELWCRQRRACGRGGDRSRAKDRLSSLRQREQQATGEQREMGVERARLGVERDAVGQDVAALECEESAQAARSSEEGGRSWPTWTATHTVAEGRVAARRGDHRERSSRDRERRGDACGVRSPSDRAFEARRDKVALERESLVVARVEHAARAEGVRPLDREPASGAGHDGRGEGAPRRNAWSSSRRDFRRTSARSKTPRGSFPRSARATVRWARCIPGSKGPGRGRRLS